MKSQTSHTDAEKNAEIIQQEDRKAAKLPHNIFMLNLWRSSRFDGHWHITRHGKPRA